MTTTQRISRRALLAGLGGAGASSTGAFVAFELLGAALAARARADDAGSPGDLVVREVALAPAPLFPRRWTLVVPAAAAPGQGWPLLVLLHGLAETADARTGAHAWLDRYGLASAYERLRRPPLERASRRADWTPERLGEVNAELASHPFQGMVIACPYTPNPWTAPDRTAVLEAFASFVVDELVPRCRADAPVPPEAKIGIDGCSLGGFVGLEVFLRRPRTFAAWGGVQSAIGEGSAPAYADRIARALAGAGGRRLHVESSTQDPYRAANERLAAELARRGIAADLRIDPGPHDQPWLREVGTAEMLLWHDRALR